MLYGPLPEIPFHASRQKASMLLANQEKWGYLAEKYSPVHRESRANLRYGFPLATHHLMSVIGSLKKLGATPLIIAP